MPIRPSLLLIAASLAFGASAQTRTLKSPTDFVKVSKDCSIFADGETKVKPGLENINPTKPLKLSDFECATGDLTKAQRAQLKTSNECFKLSAFCAVCTDNSFRGIEKPVSISSDLYECATAPRTTRYR